ncbi:hypothetical protein ACEPAG_8381 [Sanghuangporus baumii]
MSRAAEAVQSHHVVMLTMFVQYSPRQLARDKHNTLIRSFRLEETDLLSTTSSTMASVMTLHWTLQGNPVKLSDLSQQIVPAATVLSDVSYCLVCPGNPIHTAPLMHRLMTSP